jgi:hypothetical protein
MKNNLTIEEFKRILNYILDNNKRLSDAGKGKITIEALGTHGIGKTESIIQVAEERGIKVVKINLAQIEELGDLVGFPLKEYQLCDKEGQPKWISEKMIDYYLTLGYTACGDIPQRMAYAIPAWVPKDDSEVLLLLDDFRRADPRYMQATMELLSKGEYISWKLPKNCTIVLSSNPDSGDYNVSSMDAAQRTRFISFNLGFNLDVWAKWAEGEGLNDKIINFCLFYPEVFKDPDKSGITPRTIEMFAKAISGIDDFSKPENLTMINTIAEGCFESQENVFGRLFAMFVSNKLDRLINSRDILLDEWNSVSPRLRNCIYDGDKYRADISSVLTVRFLNYIDIYIKQEKGNADSSKIIMERILQLVNADKVLLSEDLIFKLVNVLVGKYPQRFNKLLMDKKLRESITNKA